MPDFNYIVRSEGGARKTGSISAKNYNEAMDKLQAKSSVVIKLTERDTSFDFFKPFLERLALEFEARQPLTPNLIPFLRQFLHFLFSAISISSSSGLSDNKPEDQGIEDCFFNPNATKLF